jgi:uncharacterized membrane protein YkvA (DUF1232 family)
LGAGTQRGDPRALSGLQGSPGAGPRRIFAAIVVGYAFSPIDLIPDPIPILGYLDDLLLIPLGVALAIHMIPEPDLAECREKARRAADEEKP